MYMHNIYELTCLHAILIELRFIVREKLHEKSRRLILAACSLTYYPQNLKYSETYSTDL